MSVREKPSILRARLADLAGELAEAEAVPAHQRDINLIIRITVDRTKVIRDLNHISKHGRSAA